jgi:3-isopropylmalate/(R)-2-methylmalate dehydratase small subunit
MAAVRGTVRKFGDSIDTDTITPGAVMHLSNEEMVSYAFGPVAPDFYTTVQAGDIIVAGSNFGCGSSREAATAVLKLMGIDYVVCDSMARIYFRNCIAFGMYPIMAMGVSSLFKEGDEIEIDLERTRILNVKTGRYLSFEPLSESQTNIIEAGGILKLLKKIAERG